MRIEKIVFFEILNALREEVKINVKHTSFSRNSFERYHIVALLMKALFVEIVGKNPITIKSKEKWHTKTNETIWKEFKKNIPPGTEFYSPVRGITNTITKWQNDKVVYYSNKILLKKISKDDFIAISKNKLTNHLENITETEKKSIINSRIGQDVLRKQIIQVYNSTCAMCKINVPKLLRASHILKWSQDKKNRLNPNNVLCLCGIHDLAFENKIITVNNDYEILITSDSNEVQTLLERITFKKLNLPIDKKYLPNKDFFEIHRSE